MHCNSAFIVTASGITAISLTTYPYIWACQLTHVSGPNNVASVSGSLLSVGGGGPNGSITDKSKAGTSIYTLIGTFTNSLKWKTINEVR